MENTLNRETLYESVFSRRYGTTSDCHTNAIHILNQSLDQGIIALPLSKWLKTWNGTKEHLNTLAATLPEWISLWDYQAPPLTPVVIFEEAHHHYIAFARYAWYRHKVLERFEFYAQQAHTTSHETRTLQTIMDCLFPKTSEKDLLTRASEPDYQRMAIATALLSPLLCLAGGPGTGKTTTVLKLLVALQLLYHQRLNIILAAPTGKAAQRMTESIRSGKNQLHVHADLAQNILNSIPDQVSTLHRLLGARPFSTQFTYHRAHPISADVIVIDEASMIDVALLHALTDAITPATRLILLGDPDQLEAVEAGAIFSELCQTPLYGPDRIKALEALTHQPIPEIYRTHQPVAPARKEAVVHLKHSYRFDSGGGIGQLAKEINTGNPAATQHHLESQYFPDIRYHPEKLDNEKTWHGFLENIDNAWAPYWEAVEMGNLEAAFKAFDTFRILSPLRQGRGGSESLNARLEIRWRHRYGHPANSWYPGRAVMIQRNDYILGCFNGDIGIAWPDHPDKKETSSLRVYFPGQHGNWHILHPQRLTCIEPAFVLTIHKSQGSEFNAIAIVGLDAMPQPSTRRTLYTALTRARHSATLWGQFTLDASTEVIQRDSITT